jgi:hypothetical protein
MSTFWEVIAPTLAILVSMILTALVGWGLKVFQQYTGIKIEEKDMLVLRAAMETGAQVALQRLGAQPSKAQAQAIILEHVGKSAPDALKRLKPGPEVLANLAVAAIERVINPTILIGDIAKQVLR